MISAVKIPGRPSGWLLCLQALFIAGIFTACDTQPTVFQLSGQTMGTTWNISYVPRQDSLSPEELERGIADIFERVNASMSTYRPESEISAFNALAADTWFSVSADFLTVLNSALEIGAYSGGAYDVTVAPLVDLWGFGPDMRLSGFPRSEEIQDGLKNVGQDRIRIDDRKSALLKTSALALDFSSIAKGYAVDVVAQWLSMQRIDNYLVEVGGEMRLKGLSGRGDPWRIAIERPQAQPQARGGVVAQALALSDVAVATSGDYRNFFEHEGQRYSHTIDPRTGYPVIHDLVSVTVLHSSAMVADAWATALTVLGPKDAMAVALEQGLAVYFIQRQGDGFLDSHTEAFEPYLEGDK